MRAARSANVSIFVPHAGCPHQCAFCDQRGISGAAALPRPDEVAATLTRATENLGERVHSAQIAFFGGSFTAIPQTEMVQLLETAQPFLGPGGFGGIRISTRPDAVDDDVLRLLKGYGVAAIELGAQSMDDGVLVASRRGHTAADVVAASKKIRGHGFSLGLQMMTGLPGDTDHKAILTAEALADLRPDTLRIYPTLVLERTPLAALWREGSYRPQTLGEAVALCGRLLRLFTARGIRVIRLGLHDSPELAGQTLAGPYHPAFRELCESAVLLEQALGRLEGVAPGWIALTVCTGSRSKMAGQRRANILALEQRGYRIKIYEEDAVPYLAVRVRPTP